MRCNHSNHHQLEMFDCILQGVLEGGRNSFGALVFRFSPTCTAANTGKARSTVAYQILYAKYFALINFKLKHPILR